MADMADRVKQVAAEESKKVKELTTDAVKSRAYLYPLKVCLYTDHFDGLNLINSRAFSISSHTGTSGSP